MKKLILFSSFLIFGLSVYSQTDVQSEIPKNQKVKVFPNPATNVINVLGLKNSSNSSITISDVYGNIVLQHKWEIKNKALNIPVANLGKGIYLLNIRSKEQTVQKKFYKK